MELTIGEKIRVIMLREGVSTAELARRTGTTRPHFTSRLSQNKLAVAEIEKVAAALGYEFVVDFEKK